MKGVIKIGIVLSLIAPFGVSALTIQDRYDTGDNTTITFSCASTNNYLFFHAATGENDNGSGWYIDKRKCTTGVTGESADYAFYGDTWGFDVFYTWGTYPTTMIVMEVLGADMTNTANSADWATAWNNYGIDRQCIGYGQNKTGTIEGFDCTGGGGGGGGGGTTTTATTTPEIALSTAFIGFTGLLLFYISSIFTLWTWRLFMR